MKIVIFMKGPVRPDVQFCVSNFCRIAQMFVEHETKFVLHTWNNKLDREFIGNLSEKFDCIVLCNEPNRATVEEKLLLTRAPEGCSAFNTFKHFLTMKNASRLIRDTYSNYDFVFFFRLDTSYNILDLNQCFERDAYVTGEHFLDVTACASPENFMNAWDYKDLPTLNALYGMSAQPEGCFGNIMKMNSVNYMPKNFRNILEHPISDNVVLEYVLHPLRRTVS